MKQPTPAQKYLALAMFLPELAQYIEDLRDTNVFKHKLAQKLNMAMNEIRVSDRKFFERGSFGENLTKEELDKRVLAIWEQQNDGREMLREFIVNNISDPYEGIIHSNSESESGQHSEQEEAGRENNN
jgi:hypothetical protein